MAQGEFALINLHLTAAMERPSIGWNPVGDHEILVMMADTAAIQRDQEALAITAERANSISRKLGHRLYHAISLRALGTLDWLKGNYAEAGPYFFEALEIFEKLETRWQAGRTCSDLAGLFAAQGSKREAAEYYRRAIGEFEAMRAKPSVERAKEALAGIESS